ncbi:MULTISPECIES: acetoacetyl-CoA reductase [Thalassomonas]|uniref:Acetoacetyl-CoA reductase n=1 Tax=Thalassomonas actiniarum TaxID=485447 RepID=A0AAF0BYJ8_9GAMM|nr:MULTISPECIES: acetoacetyl-CoA reductase [Thalassomonas]WDD97476.1 acetoacetyl-CoA reductase [Thalassomonas actiniarum]
MTQKVALVTGGTGGIGTAICQSLVKSGYRVVAGYNRGGDHEQARAWQATQREQGFEIDISYGDVTDFRSCAICIADVKEKTRSNISVLVNNAGITRDTQFKKMDQDDWRDVITTNLDSVYNMTRQVINDMITDGYGRIVNISSVNGQKGQFGQTNYSAAKAGLHGFTKALAQEVARKGVTVNTLSPGYVLTPMVAKIAPEIQQKIIEGIPVGRMGSVDEIAAAVAYLTSPDSGYITGSNLAINGGQHMY